MPTPTQVFHTLQQLVSILEGHRVVVNSEAYQQFTALEAEIKIDGKEVNESKLTPDIIWQFTSLVQSMVSELNILEQ